MGPMEDPLLERLWRENNLRWRSAGGLQRDDGGSEAACRK